jgi:hypothetical protein
VLAGGSLAMVWAVKEFGKRRDVEPKGTATTGTGAEPIVPPSAPHAAWEKKSREKLNEGLGFIDKAKGEPTFASSKNRDDAKRCLNYFIHDKPTRGLTNAQLELILECVVRLNAIHLAEGDLQENLLRAAIMWRKDRGWTYEEFEKWSKPIEEDTLKRLGLNP